jgi:Na+/alanine symporter
MEAIFGWIGSALEWFVAEVGYFVWDFGIPVGDEQIPLVVIALLGVGFYLTLRLAFIQLRTWGTASRSRPGSTTTRTSRATWPTSRR